MQKAQTNKAQSQVTSLLWSFPMGDPVGVSAGGDQDLSSKPRRDQRDLSSQVPNFTGREVEVQSLHLPCSGTVRQ